MLKRLALIVFAAVPLFAVAPPFMEIWAFAYPNGDLNATYIDYAHATSKVKTKDTIRVPLGTVIKVSANATLESGDSWYDESHYLYVFKNKPVTKTTVGSMPSVQLTKPDLGRKDIFQIIDKGGMANTNIMDPANPGVSLQWIRRGNILFPSKPGTYTFTTWARSRVGAPGGPTDGTVPVSVNVIVYALPDNMNVEAAAVPLSAPAKVWFDKSSSQQVTIPVAP